MTELDLSEADWAWRWALFAREGRTCRNGHPWEENRIGVVIKGHEYERCLECRRAAQRSWARRTSKKATAA